MTDRGGTERWRHCGGGRRAAAGVVVLGWKAVPEDAESPVVAYRNNLPLGLTSSAQRRESLCDGLQRRR